MQIKIEKRPLNKNEIILFEGIKTKKDDMAEVYIGLYIKAFEDDEEKTNINIQDEHGKTLLHHASVRGLEKTVLRLLEAGALVNIKDNEGLTPLIVAVDYLNFKQPLPDDALAQFSYKNSY
jgi:ankyrin repeat protein